MSDYTPTTDDIQRLVYEYGSSSTVKITWEDFNAWLAQVKAEAWEEGFNAGEGEAYEHEARLQWSMPHTCAKNPYREETE